MIDLETELALVPDSIRAKWELPKEVAKGLTYREGIKIKVPETTDDLAKIADYLLRDPKALIGFDTEATSQRPESAQIVGLSFSDDDGSGFYVPVGHEHGQNIDLDDALELLMPVFQLRLSMAGGKYDWHLLRRHGVDVRWGFDSQSLSRLLGEVEYGVGLKPTVARMFGERMIEFSDLVSKAKQKKGANFSIVEIGVAAQYATADAVYTRMVSLRALRTLPASVRGMLLKVEHEVMRIAGEMEWNGLPLDTEYLATKIEAGETMAQTLRREAIEGLQTLAASLGKAGQIPDDLNMNSNDQMTEALFEVCGLPVQKRSKKTKKPSVDKTVIKALAVSVPEVDWIRRFRGAEARVHDLRELYDFRLRKDGWDWVHGGLTPTGAATGRWSSSKPNLQNIPNGESVYESHHSEWRVSIRDAITAPPGWNIVTADYGQIELRVAAGESHCRFWLDGFAAGFDAHAMSGAAIHGVSTEQVTYAQRHDGKTFNFALLFGQEAKATAALLGISVAEAKHMQEAFWEGLPEVKTWIDGTYAFVKEHKYVETRFGRRRWLRGIDDDNRYIMLQNRRESVNTIVQGTAADILKIGLVRSEETWKAMGAKLFLVIHDQYVWLVPIIVGPREFCQAMDGVINFEIEGYPEMVSDYGVGTKFDSMVKYKRAELVPDTWEAALVGVEDTQSAGELQRLLITMPDGATGQVMPELLKLLDEEKGVTPVTVIWRGKELELDITTGLEPSDEIKVRAVVGSAARVELV